MATRPAARAAPPLTATAAAPRLSVQVGREERSTGDGHDNKENAPRPPPPAPLLSPQEMGQEALWLEPTPRNAADLASPPAKAGAGGPRTTKTAGTTQPTAKRRKPRVLLLTAGAGAGGTATNARGNVLVEAPRTTTHATAAADNDGGAEARRRRDAAEAARDARAQLARALARAVPEQRAELAAAAFRRARQARALRGLPTDAPDQRRAREDGVRAARARPGAATVVWRHLEAVLPVDLFPPAAGVQVETVRADARDEEDISTIGFNNTFELPSTQNQERQGGAFDSMSMSSLNEILDGPIDSPHHKKQPKTQQKGKRRLRIGKLFRSRSQKGVGQGSTGAAEPKKQARGSSSETNSKAKNRSGETGGTVIPKVVHGKVVVAKSSENSRLEQSGHGHVNDAAQSSVASKRQATTRSGAGEVKLPTDVGSDHSPSSSHSHSSRKGSFDDKYQIGSFESDDDNERSDAGTYTEYGSYMMWNPCVKFTGIQAWEQDRYARYGEDMETDSDDEREKYYVEEDKYLVENVGDDTVPLGIELSTETNSKPKRNRLPVFRWFHRRAASENTFVVPFNSFAADVVEASKSTGYDIPVPAESTPLKRSNSKRSAGSNRKVIKASSHSTSSSSEQRRPSPAKRQRMPDAAHVNTRMVPMKPAIQLPVHQPQPHYYAASHGTVPGDQPHLPSRIGGAPPTAAVTRGKDDEKAQPAPAVDIDPIFEMLKIQHSRQQRRGVDPMTASEIGSGRGIDP